MPATYPPGLYTARDPRLKCPLRLVTVRDFLSTKNGAGEPPSLVVTLDSGHRRVPRRGAPGAFPNFALAVSAEGKRDHVPGGPGIRFAQVAGAVCGIEPHFSPSRAAERPSSPAAGA